MMAKFLSLAAVGATLFASQAHAACSAPLVVDNFSKFSSNSNSLNSWTSDDGSMASISAANNKLTFKAKADSYFYETFTCQAASTNGYNSITFPFKGPAGGSFVLELQTQTSCSATTFTSKYFTVSGLTGATQTITVPFSSFSGANLNAITTIAWGSFSSTTATYELGQVQFGCGSSSASSSTSRAATTSTSATLTTVTRSSTSISSSATSSSVIVSSAVSRTGTSSAPTTSSTTGACQNLLVDDFSSQSRLTFLNYNSLFQASSDDGTMTSVVVGPAANRVTLTPKNTASYWYTQFNCVNTVDRYGGVSLRIKAAAGTTFVVQLQSSTSCSTDTNVKTVEQTTAQLGWTFDGTDKLYSIPLSKFSGLGTGNVMSLLFRNLNKAVTFGPVAFYCGTTVSEYVPPTTSQAPSSTATVPATTATAAALVIDTFGNRDSNTLGFWHGADEGMGLTWATNKLTIKSTDSDYSFYTQITDTCRDMTPFDGGYIHIAYTGSNAFTVALQQHNSACDETIAPYPETWDSIEAARYATTTDIYIPLTHFNINRKRAVSIALKGFYTTATTTLTKIEIVKTVPTTFKIPSKLPSGNLVFSCSRPNSFAFAIDDGSPEYAQQVLQIIREENIKVTFFTVGAPLLDPSTNLSNVYTEMKNAGHQIALHSYTHPKMEGLPSYADIDWEYQEDLNTVSKVFNGFTSKYFRPPFGNEGARMRQRFAAKVVDPYFVNWSVDVEDWLYAESSTPEKQLDAFKRDVAKGGNLVVMHYLYPSTVGYLKQFIQIAKASGKQLMRVDQCMQDPNAPPL